MLHTTMKTRASKRTITARLGTTFAFLALATSAVAADDRQGTFEMTAIRDAAFGGKVVAGKHDEAIEKIRSHRTRQSERFYANTNLCVAYTVSRAFAEAEKACDDALADMTPASRALPAEKERMIRRFRALALSNRGVLRAITGDERSAREDFTAALALEVSLSAPERNLARLEARAAERVTMLQADR